MPTDIKEQLATYFAWIEDRTGVELRPPAGGRVLELHDPPRRSRRWWPGVAGLVATAAAVVALLVVLDRRSDEPSRPIDTTTVTGPTTAPPPTTLQPSTTTVDSTTSPPTTAAPPASTVPTTVTPSTVPSTPPSAQGDVLSIDLPLYAFPIDALRTCASPGCPVVAAGPDGTLVAYDAATNTFWVDGSPPRTVPVIEPLNSQAAERLVVGPNEVAYLVFPTGSDPVGELVVVALSGSNAGEVIARPPDLIDLSGDSELEPTAAGLVVVGCCDASESVRPDPNAAVLVPWVDANGAPISENGPQVSIERTGSGLEVVRSDTQRRWTVPGLTGWMRGMPLTAARQDGGVMIAFFDVEASEQRLYVFKPSGTVEQIESVASTRVVALTPRGEVVVFDGQTYQRGNLPTYTEPRDATNQIPIWAGGVGREFSSADAAIDAVLATLDGPGDCEVTGSATVVERADGDPTVVTIDSGPACDDSVGSSLIELTIASDGDGTWTVVAATQRDLCIRGGGPELCV